MRFALVALILGACEPSRPNPHPSVRTEDLAPAVESSDVHVEAIRVLAAGFPGEVWRVTDHDAGLVCLLASKADQPIAISCQDF